MSKTTDRVRFSPSSRGRLTDRDLDRFPGPTLFDCIARAVCHAGCLPRKELFESWETARRVRRLFRGGRVVDLCGGHGLLAQILLLLDDTSSSALVADARLPASHSTVNAALVGAWPRLADRIAFVEANIEDVDIDADDLVVSIHACGVLTDRVLARASAARARVAVVPCCHDAKTCDTGHLDGWIDPAVAIDAMRVARLGADRYRVWTQTIPMAITPQNRLLLAAPLD
ncbi:MAG TPA: methyltransferase [Vicinamibacterales bacterium]|jgi:hypothetical protein|nr:methyltransferase [Vicinamibacterales bacterium]